MRRDIAASSACRRRADPRAAGEAEEPISEGETCIDWHEPRAARMDPEEASAQPRPRVAVSLPNRAAQPAQGLGKGGA